MSDNIECKVEDGQEPSENLVKKSQRSLRASKRNALRKDSEATESDEPRGIINKPIRKTQRRSRDDLQVKEVTYLGYPHKRDAKGGRIKKNYQVSFKFLDQDGRERRNNIKFGDVDKKVKTSKVVKPPKNCSNILYPEFWEQNWMSLEDDKRKEKYFEYMSEYNLL